MRQECLFDINCSRPVEYEEKINELFVRYLADQCSREDVRTLLHYFEAGENEALLKNLIQAGLDTPPESNDTLATGAGDRLDAVFQDIKNKLKAPDQ